MSRRLDSGVTQRMSDAAALNVALVVDTGVGEERDQAH